MIGRLRGKLIAEDPSTGELVVDVGGVGYELVVPLGTPGRAAQQSAGEVELHVHTHVREDALDLYGFASENERRANVGPKTALAVLSALPLPDLGRAVRDGDVGRLTRVPGIGKKTAERLVLELKEKLPAIARPGAPAEPREAAGPVAARPDDTARLIGALTNMGYRAAEAERAVTALGKRVGAEPLESLLRAALAELAL
jgi:Holliday junction DNA helicase RuvA